MLNSSAPVAAHCTEREKLATAVLPPEVPRMVTGAPMTGLPAHWLLKLTSETVAPEAIAGALTPTPSGIPCTSSAIAAPFGSARTAVTVAVAVAPAATVSEAGDTVSVKVDGPGATEDEPHAAAQRSRGTDRSAFSSDRSRSIPKADRCPPRREGFLPLANQGGAASILFPSG